MSAFADAEAVTHTMKSGAATFYSRSRKKQWVKGETSGNVIQVHRCERDKNIHTDIDKEMIKN